MYTLEIWKLGATYPITRTYDELEHAVRQVLYRKLTEPYTECHIMDCDNYIVPLSGISDDMIRNIATSLLDK